MILVVGCNNALRYFKIELMRQDWKYVRIWAEDNEVEVTKKIRFASDNSCSHLLVNWASFENFADLFAGVKFDLVYAPENSPATPILQDIFGDKFMTFEQRKAIEDNKVNALLRKTPKIKFGPIVVKDSKLSRGEIRAVREMKRLGLSNKYISYMVNAPIALVRKVKV